MSSRPAMKAAVSVIQQHRTAQQRETWTTVSTEGAGWLPHTRYGLGAFERGSAVQAHPNARQDATIPP
ncbi:hypothetical protein ACU635_32595 [[Actinomadura] parvosata]|uniref:hypothetical protein n=1 Tax=[Actinomadura] parvosata TaxID=1955412 RepID=UPI00406C7914